MAVFASVSFTNLRMFLWLVTDKHVWKGVLNCRVEVMPSMDREVPGHKFSGMFLELVLYREV